MRIDTSDIPAKPSAGIAIPKHSRFQRAIALCTLAYILCMLLVVTPLFRMAGKFFLTRLPTNPLLLVWGNWLPVDLHLAQDQHASQISTSNLEFLLLLAVAFVIYALAALLIQRMPEGASGQALRLIWLGTIVAGCIFVLTPAMTSLDIFVYAGYGHMVVAYHANPYFVIPAALPQDPLLSLDDWKYATAAYGPAWLVVCSLWSLILGAHPIYYILVFRLLAFAAHLFNTWLVNSILRKMQCSSRTVTLGTLLYAWNPLVLLECCLGGHNDIYMVTFMLLGILLSLRAEQRGFNRPSQYLPPIFAFTLAALIKFTAAPLIFIFLIVLIRKAFYPTASPFLHTTAQNKSLHWQSAFLKLLLASSVSGILALAFYLPFWLGHHVHEIVQSFSTPPSANLAENSILRAILEWIKAYGLPDRTSWTYIPLHLFSLHIVWNVINFATLAGALTIGTFYLWRVPTTRTLILVSLATLAALLVVTPWFYPWYVIWLVGLAVICLPASTNRTKQGLVVFALVFSASAFLTYLFNGSAPFGGWRGPTVLTTIGPPLLSLLVCLFRKKPSRLRPSSNNHTIPE